ncbi:bifunctional 6-phosphofructo-2-kinase/fructose-2,6-bisphosphate 2-phosphatase [Bimuria novae-zelandiae CBS 107.79]|uniref:Bifunctional 6-phosphofructo-2-kinase/fructose-2,6-bisphosphate 2-phosphatase n=1 Tax=Bimuria novae-zelandiae CBS 107.79 TaxID=1447943 RepID=A0A6A5VPF2_9PLEO|nr:bifunctional 6-phosphofructo-2-kinase/fructose-2,6-bisphosphate 2-phosphatase [Bimuria novae-zelandiae CBS 107.79]
MAAPITVAAGTSHTQERHPSLPANPPARRTSQHSLVAKNVLMSKLAFPALDNANLDDGEPPRHASASPAVPTGDQSKPPPPKHAAEHGDLKPLSYIQAHHGPRPPPRPALAVSKDGVGAALSDTPAPSLPGSEPGSPKGLAAMRINSTSSTPRIRPTTLDIPGLTKSKVSPDGKIAQRDVGSKLVIVMVGLPARGKSYITKKMTRYLNWLQHDTRIFNVGERRRVAAHGHGMRVSSAGLEKMPTRLREAIESGDTLPQIAAKILINGESSGGGYSPLNLPSPAGEHNDAAVVDDDAFSLQKTLSLAKSPSPAKTPRIEVSSPGPEAPTPAPENNQDEDESIEQSASFFDPTNKKAAQIREQCAMDTLDELLDWVVKGNGSVGIFDATNSTLPRRKQIMKKIRDRAGPEINVLFVESVCQDQNLLESNMRLKLSGPDYEGKDPVAALDDFKKRVAIYEKNYVPLGDYEEENNMSYVKMIDVGRKMISHQVKGFLAGQAVYYLLNFNLAPRMIWITRHGESQDNVAGRIGGDSDLSENGVKYAKAMTRFIGQQRKEWEIHQADKLAHTHWPPVAGDLTPPNPYFGTDTDLKNFCVWSSMLKRGFQTAQYFCDEDYEVKQMRMLDELNAGYFEGLTYEEIRTRHREEFDRRRSDKISYRYPGPGGEGYLDVINRIRPVIVELERMTDHCLLVTHRSVARVLLAYFQGLKREDVADLDCPLGMLYQLEPKPYGVEFKAWRYNPETDDFDHLPDYKLQRATPPAIET